MPIVSGMATFILGHVFLRMLLSQKIPEDEHVIKI